MEYSILGELCALFDGVPDKVCRVTPSRSAILPSTEIKIQNAARSDVSGELDVTFELTHSFREIKAEDAEDAVKYLCRLVKAAEESGRVRLLSMDGVSHGSDGVGASCRAVLAFTSRAANISFALGERDMSDCVLGASVALKEILCERRYIEEVSPVRERIGEDVTVTLYIDASHASELYAQFARGARNISCSVGTLCFSGKFVLASFSVGDSAKCTLRSSGAVSFCASEENT